MFYDHNPIALLSLHTDGLLSTLYINRALTILDTNISDNYDGQLSIINNGLNSLNEVHESSLENSKSVALRALREFKASIERALHEG